MSVMTMAPGNLTPSTTRRQHASPFTTELEFTLMTTQYPDITSLILTTLLFCLAFAVRDHA